MEDHCQHSWRRDLWIMAHVTKDGAEPELTRQPRPVPLERCPNCGAIRLPPPEVPPEGSGFA
jgi:hypothetical protein